MQQLKNDGLLRNDYRQRTGYNTLYSIVVLKDIIGEALWYLLAGIYAISVSSAGVARAKCVKSVATAKKQEAEWKEQASKEVKSPIKYFTMHD